MVVVGSNEDDCSALAGESTDQIGLFEAFDCLFNERLAATACRFKHLFERRLTLAVISFVGLQPTLHDIAIQSREPKLCRHGNTHEHEQTASSDPHDARLPANRRSSKRNPPPVQNAPTFLYLLLRR